MPTHMPVAAGPPTGPGGQLRGAAAAARQAPSLPPSPRAAALPAVGSPDALAVPAPPRLLYACSAAAGHDYPGHAECAARVPAVLEALEAQGVSAAARPGQVAQLAGFEPATLDQIAAIHNPKYAAQLRHLSTGGPAAGGAVVVESSPTYLTTSTYDDALRAAGAVTALVDAVVEASSREAAGASAPEGPPVGFAICRPPGHHALAASAMGFCLFNTAAIAARHAQVAHGLSKVAIFDFDVHHGNGTNDLFVDDPSVLFISTHQAGSFPGTGKVTEAGEGEGEGYTINLPLPGDSGQEAALAAFDEVVAPALRRFDPDILLVSAGYDAHWRDPLAGHQYRSSTYHALASRLSALAGELCGGRLVFLLEGGYDLKALGESVANTFRGVLGEAALDRFDPALLREEPLEKVRAVLAEARRIHEL